jgi:hypothetical protein
MKRHIIERGRVRMIIAGITSIAGAFCTVAALTDFRIGNFSLAYLNLGLAILNFSLAFMSGKHIFHGFEKNRYLKELKIGDNL